MANVMLVKVWASHTSLRASGSDSSAGPAKVSLVHEVEAPVYPS